MSMGGVDHMDQNISPHVINLHTKEWWWLLFWFVVDVAVNNTYQIYRQSYLIPEEYRLDALGFRQAIVDAYYRLYRKSLQSTTLFTGSRSFITLQTICILTVSITRLPRAHSNGAAFQDVKECRYIIAKKMQCQSSCWMFRIISL